MIRKKNLKKFIVEQCNIGKALGFQNYYQHHLTSKNGDDESLIGLDLVGGTLFDGKEIRNFAFTFVILQSFTIFLNNYENSQHQGGLQKVKVLCFVIIWEEQIFTPEILRSISHNQLSRSRIDIENKRRNIEYKR